MRAWVLFGAVAMAWGQSFEVASIKPYQPPEGQGMRRVGCQGGPGTPDPGRWSCENMSLANLITMAYDLRRFQLTAPSWLDGERFNIAAKAPLGITREQLLVMAQNLLIERFGLKLHREQKEMPLYRLVVAKGGPKLKESGPLPDAGDQPPPRPDSQPRFTMGKDGYPSLPPGQTMMVMMNGRAKRQAVRETMPILARMLAIQLDKPVTDATGLTGTYDFTLFWGESMRMGPPPPPGAEGAAPAADDSGPTLFTAVQEQLGLKLESGKGPVEILVVDHSEKSPTEN